MKARKAFFFEKKQQKTFGRAVADWREAGCVFGRGWAVDRLTVFGLFAVSSMLVTYALEAWSSWFILLFAVSCVLGSAYGFLQGAWPFGVVEAIWSVVAGVRWYRAVTG